MSLDNAIKINENHEVWEHKCQALQKLGKVNEAKGCKDFILRNRLKPMPQV